jgi:uncharacterized protein YkwD
MKASPFNPYPRPAKFWKRIPIFSRPGRRTVTVAEQEKRRLEILNARRAVHGLPPLEG